MLWETLKGQEVIEIKQLPIPKDASSTFHGRDVFAKAAGTINRGQFTGLGTKIDDIKKLDLYQVGKEGIVVRIDQFGNIVTNLPKQDKDTYSVELDGRDYTLKYYPTYDVAENELFLIEGSCNTLEISLKNGSANDKLRVVIGQKIQIS